MSRPLLALLCLIVAVLAAANWLVPWPGQEEGPGATAPEGIEEPDAKPAPVLASVPKDLPDTSGWRRHRTKGGILEVPVPEGWVAMDQADRFEPARLATGVMVAPSLADTRTGVFLFPFLPLLSAGSTEVRTLLAGYRGEPPRHVGLVLYEHPVLGPPLRRLRWPFLSVQPPQEVMEALQGPLLGGLMAEKYGIPRPAGFRLERPRRLRPDLAVAKLAFLLGPDAEPQRPVTGLVLVGTAAPDPAKGGWGLFLLFLQAPAGAWAEKAPILEAILRGVRHDAGLHVELAGEARAAEARLFARLLRIIPTLDLRRLYAEQG